MTTANLKYSLENINGIIFQGFDYTLPEKTLKIISELALHVGAPDYVKTPVFKKRENPIKQEAPAPLQKEGFRKKNNKATEILNDEDWQAIKKISQPQIVEKDNITSQTDIIRTHLNKLTDKNYIDIRNKIVDILDNLGLRLDTMSVEGATNVSSIIFDIASTNRFYSKLYADLYSDLSTQYKIINNTIESNLNKFTELFDNIEYIDPNENYDKFCEINKKNEKRKSLSTFYVNLMKNGIISKEKIMLITRNLLQQIYEFISQDNKKNEVDELTENISILYKKEIYENDGANNYPKISGGYTIPEVIEKIANSKVKDYKSLTNKSLFKFMDIIDM